MPLAILIVVAVLAAAAPATGAERRVSITDDKFDPAVAIVAPGTEVVWRNDGQAVHSVHGDFARSRDLPPGGEFRHTFRRFGHYPYNDGRDPDVEGTIIVAAASRRPGRPPGGGRMVEHDYRGTITVDVRDRAAFWDPFTGERDSPCNGQVGSTAHDIRWSATLRGLQYSRIGRLEVLSSKPSPGRLRRYVESVDSRVTDAVNGPFTPQCANGAENQPAPVYDADCRRSLTGKRLAIVLGWGPSSSRNRFQWSNDGPDLRPDDQCGESHVNTQVLAGIRSNGLPVNLVGDEALSDTGNLSPATPAEVKAIRAGRARTIRRSMTLAYTTDCCAGFNNRTEQPTGVLVRIGEVRETRVTVTIKLRPR